MISQERQWTGLGMGQFVGCLFMASTKGSKPEIGRKSMAEFDLGRGSPTRLVGLDNPCPKSAGIWNRPASVILLSWLGKPRDSDRIMPAKFNIPRTGDLPRIGIGRFPGRKIRGAKARREAWRALEAEDHGRGALLRTVLICFVKAHREYLGHELSMEGASWRADFLRRRIDEIDALLEKHGK
jgi:hypothetical protein